MKRVPAPGAKINVTDDGQAVDAANLGFTTSPHEECALEAAVQLVEEHGGEVTVLTLGPVEAEEQLRYAASVGADSCVLISTDGTAWDPQRTAAGITETIGDLEATEGEFDLILFGNESADSGGFQVGVRVAYAMSLPMVNGIKGIEIEGSELTAQREVDGGYEIYHMSLPAVLGVKEGINLPRYPTMKGRLAARKAAIDSRPVEAEAGGLTMARLHRPEVQISETEILGTSAEAASAVVDLLEELGVT